MNRFLLVTVISLILLCSVLVVLFGIQNSIRTTQLSLDLGIAAWSLSRPATIPEVVGASFAAGFGLATLLVGSWGLRHHRRARRLEQQLALSGTPNDDWRS